MKDKVVIYTDGACKGNPGPGGWGAVLQYRHQEKHLFGGAPDTTNNRMELSAVIHALTALTRPCVVTLYTDSQYLQLGMTQWLPNWRRRNFRSAGGKVIKNADLWRQLEAAAVSHTIEWVWVRGHAECAGNVQADKLANRGAQEMMTTPPK